MRSSCTVPSRRTSRASTSIRVSESCEKKMAFPSSPSGTRMRQRCTVTPREKVLRTSVSASVPSGNCGFTLRVVDSSIAGTFQRTS